MGKLRAIVDGFDNGRDGRGVAAPRPSPIAIDEVFPITTDPKEYLEGRVAFYIALLERLVGVGADRGDPYFVKECLDALLKMTNIGRAKMDVNMTGTLSKLRDEIDFTKMEKEDLAAFVEKARGEINVRNGDMLHAADSLRGDSRDGDNVSDKKPRRKRKKQHNYADARVANESTDGGDSGESAAPTGSCATTDGTDDDPDPYPG